MRIVRAGLSRLVEIPGVGEKKAEKILAAAQEWLAAHAAAPPGSELAVGEAGYPSKVGGPVVEEAGVLPVGPQPEAAGPQP